MTRTLTLAENQRAQPLVRLSYVDPLETYNTNIIGTANILEAIRNCESVRTIVAITTDKCYENIEEDYAYVETDPLGGYDPYIGIVTT